MRRAEAFHIKISGGEVLCTYLNVSLCFIIQSQVLQSIVD